MAYDPELAARALSALAEHPDVRAEDIVEKQMFGGVSYLLDGAMAVGVLGEDLVIRASPQDAERYLAEAHVRPMDFTGRPMKGWLYVHADAVRTDAALLRWVHRAVDFVRSAPRRQPAAKRPPTTRKSRDRRR